MLFTTDSSFWPNAVPIPDFNLKFEESIIEILPSGSFLFFASATFLYYRLSPARIRPSPLLWWKVVSLEIATNIGDRLSGQFTVLTHMHQGIATLLILHEIAGLVLRCLSEDRTQVTYSAAAIDLAAALAVGVVVYIEHRHTIRTSTLLGFYLAVGILIDATKSRSYFMRDLFASSAASAAAAAVRFAMLCLEEVPRRNLVIDPNLRRISDGEATSGFFSRIFFIFLQPMMYIGFRRILTMKDLGGLGIDLSSMRLFSDLNRFWPASKRSRKHSLFFACCIAWKGAFLAIIIPRLCATGLLFAQPFLLHAIVACVGEPISSKNGGLVAATFLTFFGSAICRAASTHMKNRFVTRVRGGLISQLFDKSTKLKLSDAKKQAAITLMSADFEAIAAGLPSCIEIPFAVVDAALGMYFLSDYISQSCLVILGPLLFSTVGGILLGRRTAPALRFWNENIQSRLATTSRALSQLPAIKSLGLGPKIAEYIQYLRVVETLASRKYRYLNAAALGLTLTVDLMTPVIVVTTGLFTRAFGDTIKPEVLFPTLGIVAIVQVPLAELMKAYPAAMSMLACFERVRLFLCQEENVDPRVVLHSSAPEDLETPACIMRFEKAAIAPRGVQTPLLQNVDLVIKEGAVSAMYGPTSSGKTTLFEGLLGEAELLDGVSYVDESATAIAYCGQEPYLPNATVRECVVGTCEYDDAWFKTVITACKLQQDLDHLPNGADYVIGSDGIALSGGQRKRIAIARAVYARTKAVFLDDVFSALDKETAVGILKELCGEGGLLRQANCAVIISSYLSECLDVADQVIILDGEGNVHCKSCLPGSDGRAEVSHLLRDGCLTRKIEPEQATAPPRKQRPTVSSPTTATTTTGVQRVNDTRRRGDSNLYTLWINAVGRKRMLFWVLLVVVLAVMDALPPIFVKLWLQFAPSSRTYLIGYALISLAGGLLASVCVYFIHIRLAPRASVGLHEKLIGTVTRATYGFISNADSGELLNRFSEDMELLAQRVPGSVYATLYCGLYTVVQTAAIVAGATYMTATLPFVLVGLYFLQRYYLRTSRQLRVLSIEAQAPLVTAIKETSTGIVHIRGFGWQSHGFRRALQILDESQKPFYFLLTSQAFLSLASDLIAAAVAVVLTVLILYVRDSSSPNAAGLAFLNLIVLGNSFNVSIKMFTNMETAVGALQRLREFLFATPTEERNSAVLPESWPSQGDVQIELASARYKSDAQDNQAPVLHDVSLHIEPGKKIGIMGRTGGGKSSLLYSLLGFLEYQGSIIVDGVDIKTVDPDQLRARIITISQDVVQLDGTVRDNLLPYEKTWPMKGAKLDEKATREAKKKDQMLQETLDRLRLWDQLESTGGLGAKLEEVGYSHGDIQLFCIARAVVRRRLTGGRLVLIDEATASVDHWRDAVVREMVVEFFGECTILAVAHRPETIADADSTVYIADGRIERIRHH